MTISPAYAAGLIDGEGCIHLGVRKGTYRARVTVGMTATALPLLTAMQGQWGGALNNSRKATNRWDSAWAWSLQGQQARQFLREISPHLILKVEQSALALDVEEIRASLARRPNGGGSWTPAARAACEQIKSRMHALNAKGPATAQSAEVA